MLRIPETKIVFVHIPKTGGQTLKATFKMETDTPVHTIASPTDKKYIKGDYWRFCVTRNPIDRFISVYKYNLRPSRSTGAVGALGQEISANGAASDINEFCRLVANNREEFMRYSHLRSQSYYIKRTRPQIKLRVEHLDRDIRIIFRLSGKKPKKLGRLNASTGHNDGMNLDLNDHSVDILRDLYADDFNLLGYK